MNLETQKLTKWIKVHQLQITNYGLLNLFVNSKHVSPKRFPNMTDGSSECKR